LTAEHAGSAEIDLAVACARSAFMDGPWAWMNPAERVGYLRQFAALPAGYDVRGE
jgi:acyl-CoA reductase-like NAD-dependent aldehyde dehydrogenase